MERKLYKVENDYADYDELDLFYILANDIEEVKYYLNEYYGYCYEHIDNIKIDEVDLAKLPNGIVIAVNRDNY